MRISPINNRQNQVSHKAVNQKFLKQARDKYYRCAPYHNQAPLISNMTNYFYYGLITRQDFIDTLEAIKPYTDDAIEWVEELIETLNSNQ